MSIGRDLLEAGSIMLLSMKFLETTDYYWLDFQPENL